MVQITPYVRIYILYINVIQSFGFSLSMEKVRVKVLDSVHLARPGLNY
jgi:hypothetical protein